jgi:hypothetical protein
MSTPAVDKNAVSSYVVDFSSHKKSFILSPKQWKNFKLATSLTWEQELLCDSKVPKIPEKRGVYAHSISLKLANMPPTNYVTYVGLVGDKKKTGLKGDNRHLRQRFREYLKEKEAPGRALVWDMLSKYDGFMWFHYAEVPDHTVSLHKIETALLDALLPPCNQKDFSINIKQAYEIVTRM